MKRCIIRQASTSSQGSAPNTCAVCSVSKKKPATIRKPQVTIPIGVRHHGCSCRSSFMDRVLVSACDTLADKIVKRSEYQRDVPAPDEALRHPQTKAAPAQQFKTRQKDRQRRMLHGE